MKISDIRATTVTVPLEAPLRHANGCHWGRFVRTIIEVETDEGLVGLGEMGGGGESAEEMFRALKGYLVGHDPARLEQMRFLIANPTASLYNNRTQVLAALEFACLDILGQRWGVPVSEILGGRLQDRVPFASYLFFRYPNRDGTGEVRTPEQLVGQARAEGAVRLHLAQAEGGRFPAGVRAGMLPPARGLARRRPLPLRPQRRLVGRDGHLVRSPCRVVRALECGSTETSSACTTIFTAGLGRIRTTKTRSGRAGADDPE